MSDWFREIHEYQRNRRRTFPPTRKPVSQGRRWPAASVKVSSQTGGRSALQRLRALPRILPWRQRTRRRRITSNRLDRPCRETAPAKEYVGKEDDRTQAAQGRR